ncbi:unnamed protein product [Meganyctiphanes norvegica]|uniref:EF-hand domain-containing protein n=1 Tax=Meganyctiphanes norvegica TaxID=48144 RepID=A0AAV2R668_MEGNR
MSLWLALQTLHGRGLQKLLPKMQLHGRLRIWVCLALAYLIIMGLVHLFHLPLRSNTLHSHYDMTGEYVMAKHRASMQKEMEKLEVRAKAAEKLHMDPEEQINILTKIFKKSDENADGELDLNELSSAISKKIKEHLSQALRENFYMFTSIDNNPKNGRISWEEYHAYFLKQRGYDDAFIKNHKENHRHMPREIKEAIMRDKAAWSQAARDDPNTLTIDEFLSFRHPESSHATILTIVEETIGRLDMDDDNELTPQEFSDPSMNEVPDDMTLQEFQQERLHEFKTIIDTDNNGKIDRRELLMYIDPRNVHHAEKEAVLLLGAADVDHDGVLNLEEILDKREMFIVSKLVDAAKSFHDEF